MTIDEAMLKAASAWDAIARMHGYNEMSKIAATLGEQVYCRMACDAACEEAVALGAEIQRTETGGEVLFTIAEVSPSIQFRESDLEKMRAAIQAYDSRTRIPGSDLPEEPPSCPEPLDECEHLRASRVHLDAGHGSLNLTVHISADQDRVFGLAMIAWCADCGALRAYGAAEDHAWVAPGPGATGELVEELTPSGKAQGKGQER